MPQAWIARSDQTRQWECHGANLLGRPLWAVFQRTTAVTLADRPNLNQQVAGPGGAAVDSRRVQSD